MGTPWLGPCKEAATLAHATIEASLITTVVCVTKDVKTKLREASCGPESSRLTIPVARDVLLVGHIRSHAALVDRPLQPFVVGIGTVDRGVKNRTIQRGRQEKPIDGITSTKSRRAFASAALTDNSVRSVTRRACK